jgi:hypothetical protein
LTDEKSLSFVSPPSRPRKEGALAVKKSNIRQLTFLKDGPYVMEKRVINSVHDIILGTSDTILSPFEQGGTHPTVLPVPSIRRRHTC